MALLAGILFFTYPFHNESVAWILGRGAMIADTLGIAALLILVRPGKEIVKIIGVCACYFIGLAAYETIVILPAMIFIYLLCNKARRGQIVTWGIALGFTLVLHVLLRRYISGRIAGDYGEGFLNGDLVAFAINAVKALGRTFLPPMDASGWLIVLFIMILLLAIGLFYYLRKRLMNDKQALSWFYMQGCFFLVALLIPSLVGVSTRTSESDRLLNFASYFFSTIVAFGLVHIISQSKWLLMAMVAIVTVHIYLLEQNNLNWHKASTSVREILALLGNNETGKKTYVANLPEEINGAFVFRAGFREALLLNNIDTAGVQVLSSLTRDTALLFPDTIHYTIGANGVMVPPFLRIEKKEDHQWHLIRSNCYNCNLMLQGDARLVYWNRKKWVKLPL
ncbi:hypothetical protein D3H65_16240 [Paraflavitalea soli]|uniref:Uncharacterized protein n=1 Tax=Paraflavitalea soli TaxID=2315862 RepID=A0A3B7MUX5_9BACT|nr:hypothetical protein D3H65_16240 [Paraflavitalea soli]